MKRRRPNPDNKNPGVRKIPRRQRRMAFAAAVAERGNMNADAKRALWRRMQDAWRESEERQS